MFKNYFKLLVFLGVFVGSWLAGFDVGAQTTNWTGANSTDWSDGGNWTLGVPNTTTNLRPALIPAGAPNNPTLTANVDVLSVSIEAGKEINLSTFTLKIATTLTVGDQTPFTSPNSNTGVLAFENGLNGTTGPLTIERTGNGAIDIPRLEIAGAVSLSFVTGTHVNLTADGGGAATPILFMDATSASGNFGIDTGENGILTIDATGNNHINYLDPDANTGVEIGIGDLGGNGLGLGSVQFVNTGTISIENTHGAAVNSRLTVWSDLVLGGNAIVQQEPTPGDATTLRLNADLTNNSTANPILHNGGLSGQIVFSNTLNDQAINNNFMTISHLHVNKSNGNLILNTSVLVDGTAGVADGIASDNLLQISGGVSDINLNGAAITLTLDPNDVNGDQIFMSNVPPGGNEIYGTGKFIIDGDAVPVIAITDVVVNTNMQIGSSHDDASSLDLHAAGANSTLYFGGSTLDIYEDIAFVNTDGEEDIQFIGNSFQTVTNRMNAGSGPIILPALSIAKQNGADVTLASSNDQTEEYQINVSKNYPTLDGAVNQAASIVFASADDYGNASSDGAGNDPTQLIISGATTSLSLGLANTDITDHNGGSDGNISGAGDLRFNALVDLGSDMEIGTDLLINGQDLQLLGFNLGLGGDVLDGLTVGDGTGIAYPILSEATANNEFITFAGSTNIPNASNNTSLDLSIINNVVVKRKVRVEQALRIDPDGGNAGISNVMFDGGSFVSANNITLDVYGNSGVHFMTGNTGMFANQFVTINSVGGATELDIHYADAAMTTVQFTSIGTGLYVDDANMTLNLDGNATAGSGHIKLGGDLVSLGAPTLFTGLDPTDYVIFEVAGTAGTHEGVAYTAFSTVTRIGGGDLANYNNGVLQSSGTGYALDVPRLKVESTHTYAPPAGDLQCFTPAQEMDGGVLAFATSVNISGPNAGGVLLDLSNNGFISVSPDGADGAALILAVDGNIKTAVDPNYSAIVGDGWLVFGGNNQFTPAGGNIIMGIKNWTNTTPLALTSELALTGNLFITISPVNSTESGAIRLIGGNFQTVAPGKSASVTGGAGTDLGFIPNLIIDKCQNGPFVTAFQSAGWNMMIGRTGTLATDPQYGFMSVQSGVFAMNGFTTINGNGNDGGLFISALGSPSAALATTTPANATFLTSGATYPISGAYSSSGISFGNVINKASADAYQMISVTSNTATVDVEIPNLVLGHYGNALAGRAANLRVQKSGAVTDLDLLIFNTASTYTDPALYLAADNNNNQGNLQLYDNELFITGGGNVVVRQENDNAAGFGSLVNGNNFVKTNFGIVQGNVVVEGPNTSMVMTTVTNTGLASLEASRFTIDGDLTLNFGGVTLNNNFLELRKNLIHNSFATAFVTGGVSGVVQMTSTSGSINFKTAQLQIPSLLVDNTVNVFNTASGTFNPATPDGGSLVIGNGRALALPGKTAGSFVTAFNIGTSLRLNGAFLTVTGDGGYAGGSVDGGRKDATINAANQGGGAWIDAFVTVGNNGLRFSTAGLYVVDGTNATVPAALGRIHTQANTLTLGGNLYEQTGATSTTGADAFITTNDASSTGGLVVFDCTANTTQFIQSNGGPSVITPNVFISGNEVTLGTSSTLDRTSDNVQLYLGGQGTTSAKATLSLANGGSNDVAKLNLGFNSVTILAGNGALLDDDNRSAGETSIIGFGTVMVTANVTPMVTVGTHFGIADDLISDGANPQINLGGNSLFLGGDYANNTNITKTFIPTTINDNSTLVLNGTASQALSLITVVGKSPNGTAEFTEIPHITVAGVGTTLGSHVAAYGGAGDALHLNAPLYLNGQFMTVTNEGTAVNAVYASSTAFISGLATGDSDGIYFKTGTSVSTTNLRSNLTVLEAKTLIHDGHAVNMTENFTLSLGGDLESTNGTGATGTVSITNGGASITSADANGHGWVKFITSVESTGTGATDYDLQGIAKVPALAVEMGGYVNFMNSPGSGFTSITSNVNGEVLKFMSGTFNLHAGQTLAVTGNGNNTITDAITGNYQVFDIEGSTITTETGTLYISGSGTTTMELGDYDNNNGSELTINPGLTMRGTAVPQLRIAKPGLTSVILGGNLYLGTPSKGDSDTQFLSIGSGTLDLKGNNIQFMTLGGLRENSSAGNVIVNSGTTNYPANGSAYVAGETPWGVVFATGIPEIGFGTGAMAPSLGLYIFDGALGGKYNVELRKDAVADGADIYGNRVNIARNYKVQPVEGTVTGGVLVTMPFTTAELDGLGKDIKSTDLAFMTFGAGGVTPNTAGVYKVFEGTTTTNPFTNSVDFTTSVTSTSNGLPNYFSGYLTLGVRPVNIVHDTKFVNGVAQTDTSLDAEADEDDATNTTPSTAYGTAGRYRILNPTNASNFTVTFTTAIPGNDGKRYNEQGQEIPGGFQPQYSADGINGDFYFATSPDGTGRITAAGNEFALTIPAGQTETPLYVIPLDDSYVDGNEFLSVSIISVNNGMVLGKFTTATMQILDNDIPGFNVQINNRGSVKGGAFTTVGANYQVTSTTDIAGGFITVNEYVDGDGQPVLESTIGVNLRQQPIPGKVVYLRMTIPTGTTATVDTNLDLNGQADVDGVNEAMFTSVAIKAGANAGTFITSTGATLQTTQWLDIPFSADGSTIGGVDTYLWSEFVSVTLQGKNDFIADHGQALTQRHENFHVVVEVEKTKTTSIDYLEPNKLLPSNATDPNTLSASLGKVVIYGTNLDDERALEFNFSLNQNLVENTAGNGTAVISVKPNIPVLQDATLVLTFSNEKDAACDYNSARALFQTAAGNVTTVEIPYKQEAFDTRFITLVATANQIDDDTEKVLIKASVKFAGTSFPLAENLVASATGGNSAKDITNTFNVPVFDDADNAEIKDVDNNISGFVNEAPIWVFNTKELDKQSVSYPVELNSMPRGDVFVTAYVEGADDAARVDVTSNAAEHTVVNTTINGKQWTGVVLKLTNTDTKFITVTVKDNTLKDGDKLVRLRFANATVENSCDSKYASLKPLDAFIRITDDATDTDVVAKPGTAPAKVAGLVATAGSKQVVLNWAPNAEAGITYQVYYYSAQLGQSKQLAGETTATNFTVTGLTNGVEYTFEIVAVKKDNNGNITAKGETSEAVNAKPSIILGTEEAVTTTLSAWPNPSPAIFNVRLENLKAEQLEVKVLSVTGQEIYSTAHGKVNGEFETKIELNGVPAGMYVLIVNTDNGSFRKKLVLTR